MQEIKKIDIHVHATAFPSLFPPFRAGDRFISAEEIIAHYDKLNIEKGVLLPIVSHEGQVAPLSNEGCKLICDKYPDRFVWFCNVDPRADANDARMNFAPILDFYKAKGARGFGELTSQVFFDDARLDNLLSFCEDAALPVLFHISPQFGGGYGVVDDFGLPRFERMLKKHHKLIFLGHSQAFWSEISSDLKEEERWGFPTGKVTDGRVVHLMREYGNLYGDLSANSGMNAVMRDEDFGMRFMEEFKDRLLYGTDFCANGNTHPYAFDAFLDRMLDEKKLGLDTYKKIVRENAIRLLRLDQ